MKNANKEPENRWFSRPKQYQSTETAAMISPREPGTRSINVESYLLMATAQVEQSPAKLGKRRTYCSDNYTNIYF